MERSKTLPSVLGGRQNWFSSWLLHAGLYLIPVTGYLGLVAAFKSQLEKVASFGVLTNWVIAIAATLPVLLALFFNVIPRILRWVDSRRLIVGPGSSTYFSTAPRSAEDKQAVFDEAYCKDFLAWLTRDPFPSPLLHLTGPSGCGKSSLLSGYLKPRLEKSTAVIVVRSYANPLVTLKAELLNLWKAKPDWYDAATLSDTLRHAARHVNRLLVVFDQFEEFFLVRAEAAGLIPTNAAALVTVHEVKAAQIGSFGAWASYFGLGHLRKAFRQMISYVRCRLFAQRSQRTNCNGTESPKLPHDNSELIALRLFFETFLKECPTNVALLLSYRDDYPYLKSLGLPARTEYVDWQRLDPWTAGQAYLFLKSCPNFEIPEALLHGVLREAAHHEGGRIYIRPIVANLLGIVLRWMQMHPKIGRRRDDLLRNYVRWHISGEFQDPRAALLQALVTGFHTARPRSIADLASVTRVKDTTVVVQLENLGHANLARCLNSEEKDDAKRVWQISHDFIANLLERVLEGMHRPVWRKVRPWLAPAALIIVILLAYAVPQYQSYTAHRTLNAHGLTWNEDRHEAIANGVLSRNAVDDVGSALRVLNPSIVDLRKSKTTNLAWLGNLKHLTILSLPATVNESELVYLGDLENLTTLTLLGTVSETGVTELKNVKKLTTLDLRIGQVTDALKGLPQVKTLTLHVLNINEKGLKVLADVSCLTMLDLSFNSRFTGAGLKELRSLSNLAELNLTGTNVDDVHLKELTCLDRITTLDLSATEITDDGLKELKGLKNLATLTLNNGFITDAGLRELKHLAKLTTLDLGMAGSRVSEAALMEMKQLKSLTMFTLRFNISQTMLEDLKRSLPTCEIFVSR